MFADIGIGILISITASYFFDASLTPAMVAFAVIFSLLPDIDMLVFVFPPLKKILIGHRGTSHFPIIYLPIFAGVWFFFGTMWAFIFGTSILLHLIHDTFWIGHGVKWLWPFSTKAYKFFPQDKLIPPGVHWIRVFYLMPNIVTITEYIIFFVSLIVLGFYIR